MRARAPSDAGSLRRALRPPSTTRPGDTICLASASGCRHVMKFTSLPNSGCGGRAPSFAAAPQPAHGHSHTYSDHFTRHLYVLGAHAWAFCLPLRDAGRPHSAARSIVLRTLGRRASDHSLAPPGGRKPPTPPEHLNRQRARHARASPCHRGACFMPSAAKRGGESLCPSL